MTNESETIINKLFTELAGCKPAWKTAFSNTQEINESKRQWFLAFEDVELNKWEWIERGLSKARQDTSPYFPSVGQFIEWCRPEPRFDPYKGLSNEQRALFEASAKIRLEKKQ